jgi:hypothetical protein
MVDEVLVELRELRARVELLEADNARLRDLRASSEEPDAGSDAPVDRRRLLKLAGKTAVVGTGLAAGAALLGTQPASASHLPGFGHSNDQGTATTSLAGNSTGEEFSVRNGGSGAAIVGRATGGRGVEGLSRTGTGVYARSFESNALTAEIDGDNGFNAVYARCGGGSPGNAVFGEVTGPLTPGNAVLGIHNGPGNCVFGYKPSGVSGDAVVGVGQTGRGVLGVSTSGRGGVFNGKKAQVQLQASTATTHPSSGARGDLFVDNAGRLWFCKGGTTWKQLA